MVTHSVPTSPPSKAKPKPHSTGYVTGIGTQHGIWYNIEHEIQPLYDAFSHDQRHVAPLPVFPASNCPSGCNACRCNAIYGCIYHVHLSHWSDDLVHQSDDLVHLPDGVYDKVAQNVSNATAAAPFTFAL